MMHGQKNIKSQILSCDSLVANERSRNHCCQANATVCSFVLLLTYM